MNPKRHHCKQCGKLIDAKRVYCNDECKRTKKEQEDLDRKVRAKKPNAKSVIEWRQRLKIRAIEHMGGRCRVCKYDRCNRALIFHHVDSSQKAFGISASGTSRSWEKIKEVLRKCVLLCQNCHMEVHDGLISLESFILG